MKKLCLGLALALALPVTADAATMTFTSVVSNAPPGGINAYGNWTMAVGDSMLGATLYLTDFYTGFQMQYTVGILAGGTWESTNNIPPYHGWWIVTVVYNWTVIENGMQKLKKSKAVWDNGNPEGW